MVGKICWLLGRVGRIDVIGFGFFFYAYLYIGRVWTIGC